jgi:arylsulfatase A-like enzyme
LSATGLITTGRSLSFVTRDTYDHGVQKQVAFVETPSGFSLFLLSARGFAMKPVCLLFVAWLCSFVPLLSPWFALGAEPARSADRPNVVLIFCDDLGYADVGCFGAKSYATPNIDRLAREGRRFTDFYVAQAICSSSRAALLTGCYPNRIGVIGALGPKDRHGISDNETTLAQVLKSQGYATAAVGKWHLGHHPQFLPTRHGFDQYFGLPYSNDMWPNHPTNKTFPPLPLIENETTIETNPDQAQLTTRYTERAVEFIQRRHEQPFFLYLAHSMPHVPLFVSDKYKNRSGARLYGDVVQEIDWSIGQVLATLDRLRIAESTLVIFTSDNGPWQLYGDHAGSTGVLRESKATAFEGGVREPCMMRWPGHIPAGSECAEPLMTIDLLPTIARLAGAETPSGHSSKGNNIDGLDVWPLLAGESNATNPHEAYYFYFLDALHAVRSGRWKLHLPHPYNHVVEPGRDGLPGRHETRRIETALFELETDPGETTNVASSHPEIVAKLEALAEAARDDLGDSLTKRVGRNVRQPGRLAD